MAKKKENLAFEERLEKAIVPEGERPYKVPDNWVWTRLGEVTDIVGGGTPSSTVPEYYENGNIPWISPVDLSGYTEKYISNGKKNITELGLQKSSAKLMPTDTVLLSSRAPIGYVAIANNKLCTNQGFKSFLPSKAFIPSFLYWYLKHSKELLESYASGTTFLELSGSKASLVEFPLPPLAEQQRIVERIESLFPKLDEAKEKVQTSLDSFEKRKAAILNKAFTGELTQKWREENGVSFDSWRTDILKNVSKISSGGTPSRTNPDFYTGNIPWIKTGEIFWNDIYDSEEKITNEALENSSAKVFPVDTVVVAMYGMGVTRGRAGILKVRSATNQAVCALIPNGNLKTEILFYYFMNNYEKFRAQSVGGNQLNLSGKIISGFEINIPDLPEQTEIVRILDSIFEKEKQAKELVSSIGKIDLMKKAILARAFRGELGTNDPEEESAIELLKEILEVES